MFAFAIWLTALAPELPQPARYNLDWDAPPTCPSAEAVHSTVDDTLGPSAEPPDRTVEARAVVSGDDTGGFELELEIEDQGRVSHRQIKSAQCSDLAETAALLIAMTVDPRLAEGVTLQRPTASKTTPLETASPPPRAEAAQPPVATPVRADEPDPSPPKPEPRPPLSFVALAGGGVGTSALPGLSGVVGLDLGVEGRKWRAAATASYWTPREGGSSANEAVGVRAQLWTVGARGCGIPRVGAIAFPLCIGAEAGLMHARGTGELRERLRANSPWAAVTFGPGVTWWALGRLGFGLHVRGHAAVARPDFTTEPSGRVHQAGPVGVAAVATIEVRAPK